jgi:hypothetical protein
LFRSLTATLLVASRVLSRRWIRSRNGLFSHMRRAVFIWSMSSGRTERCCFNSSRFWTLQPCRV